MPTRINLRHPGRRLAVCLLPLLLAMTLRGAASDSPGYAEYEVKAAMLFNFTRFVEWPPQSFKDDKAPLTVCVLGSDPFGRSLDEALRDKQYGARSIRTRRLHSPAETDGCHILFIARSERGRLPAILAALRTTPVLTVSDMDGFSQSGWAIEFTLDGNRIRFEINQASAQASGVTISSKLLKLASRVRHEGGAWP